MDEQLESTCTPEFRQALEEAGEYERVRLAIAGAARRLVRDLAPLVGPAGAEELARDFAGYAFSRAAHTATINIALAQRERHIREARRWVGTLPDRRVRRSVNRALGTLEGTLRLRR